jgi:hypothetical protein
MNNFNTFNNCLKIISILIFVYIILKYVVVMSSTESIILATIITVVIILIENLLFRNNKNMDIDIPKSCNSCKINIPKKSNTIDDNILVLSESENKSLLVNENFTSVDSVDNDYEYRCYKTRKENFDYLNNDMSSLNENEFITPIPSQSPTIDMSQSPQQDVMHQSPQQDMMQQSPQQDIMQQSQQQDIMQQSPQQDIMQLAQQQDIMQLAQLAWMRLLSGKPAQSDIMPLTQQVMGPTAQQSTTDKPVYMQTRSELDTNIIMEDIQNRGGNTYDVDSVQYQQDGIQNEEDNKVLDNNIFRMSVGNRSVVNKFIESGGKYYGDILTRSTNAPSKFQAATNELKYGDFNYIAPLNKGMINPTYTFVSPTNWYPIPPHPPVCVTNKRCTTSPVIISDGKDYMNFASLEDFDASRRFTGDMGINIDYIKNVLNNADGN